MPKRVQDMHLAILVGSNPKTANISARVRLRAGNWELVHEGLNDSILNIHVLTPHISIEENHQTYEMRGDSSPLLITIENKALIYVDWTNRGNEKAISLSAHIKNGT